MEKDSHLKLPKNSVRIVCIADVLDTNGELLPISVSDVYDIESLTALGHYQQEMICEELEESLIQKYTDNDNYIGITDVSYTCEISSIEIELDGSEFISKLRGLYARTHSISD